jgi:hypothetical protein
MNIIIYKGAKFYCPACKSLFVTALMDLHTGDVIKTRYFEFAEGQKGEPHLKIRCKCNALLDRAFRNPNNWKDNFKITD